MKRILLVAFAALMFVNTLAIPTLAHADDGGPVVSGGNGSPPSR